MNWEAFFTVLLLLSAVLTWLAGLMVPAAWLIDGAYLGRWGRWVPETYIGGYIFLSVATGVGLTA